VSQDVLRRSGLDANRLETIVSAAPKDYKAAVVFVSGDNMLMGWFLGNYFEVPKPLVVQKRRGESVAVRLSYDGSLPQIVGIE
jgi:hypothetical protein